MCGEAGYGLEEGFVLCFHLKFTSWRQLDVAEGSETEAGVLSSRKKHFLSGADGFVVATSSRFHFLSLRIETPLLL